MSGMAEILDENTRLRKLVGELGARVEAEAAEKRLLLQKVELLVEQNERFARHFEFLEKKQQLAKAERFIADANQAELFADQPVQLPPRDPTVQREDEERPTGDKRKTARHKRKGRRDLTQLDLPKQRVEAPVTASTCAGCGGDRELTEPKITHRLGWQPGRHVLVEVHQQQCACPRCPDQGTWTAPEPFLLPGSMCDDALLAKVIIDKFGDHLPLNRQSARMKRRGVPVSSNVLSGWVTRGFREVRPLIKAVMQQVANSGVIQSDDSGFGVQDGTDGKLANGRLWVFTDQKQAFFGFSRTKEGHHPADLLESLDVSGTLIADGGSEYNEATSRLALERGGCWSHLRRYFHEAAVQHEEAKVGLMAIRDVFLIERDLVDLPPAERVLARMERSQPVVDGFFDWVKGMSQQGRPTSKLGAALGYALSQEGIKTNVTLCFSSAQALLAAKAGATYISPFVGRLDDIAQDGMGLISDICQVYSMYPDIHTEVLVASIRNPIHLMEAAKMGADVATIPPKVIHQLFKHPLTDAGLEAFMKDVASTKQSIL